MVNSSQRQNNLLLLRTLKKVAGLGIGVLNSQRLKTGLSKWNMVNVILSIAPRSQWVVSTYRLVGCHDTKLLI